MKIRKVLLIAASAIVLITSSTIAVAEIKDTYISNEIQDACIKYGEEYNICPELIMAMIEAESSGDPNAKNGTCKGLMQVSVTWHKERMAEFEVTDIYDIDGNIHVGTDYLAELIEENDEISFALDRYNGNSKATYNYEHGIISPYAKKILERSAELERVHGK